MLARIKQYAPVLFAILMAWPALAAADLLTSPHYQLNPDVASSFGGTGSSANYALTNAGGEAVVGSGSSQSYMLTQGYVSQLTHSIQISVMPAGTYAYWPLDTGTGTAIYDVSTTADRGILQNAPSWATGKIGQAVSFNGSSQYLSTSTAQADPNTFTLELWFKTTTTNGGELMGFGDAQTGSSTNRDRLLYMTNGGQLVFGTKPSTTHTISSSGSYNDGNWHYVAATEGAAGLTLGVDGTRVASDGATTTGGNYTGYWRAGFDSLSGWPSAPTSNYFAGTLDELHVYSRQLSDAEAAGDYSAGNSGMRFAHTLPTVTPGTSQKYDSDVVVQTDAGGYDLSLQAPSLLTNIVTAATFPMVTAAIGSPAAWVEGTTKGLGFSVTSGTQVEAKWGTGPYNYAAIPAVAAVYHSRDGLNGGVPEKTSVEFRADASPIQASGTYTTTIIYTATLKP